MPEFGKLEQVEIGKGWPSEPRDFTPWLFEVENIAALGQELGIDLEPAESEFGIGNFSLDILARRIGTDELVVIENQFGSTDHTHLGQLMTYAAGASSDGGGARTIIWIAENFREEHRAALDWLNRSTEPNVRFFGAELQLWKIGNSPYAPKFSVISKPNEWQKQITQDAAALSVSEKTYLEFWDSFFALCANNLTKMSFSTAPKKVWWLPTRPSGPGCGINLNATRKSKKLECHVWIEGARADENFKILKTYESELKAKLGESLCFDDMPGKSTSKICISTSGEVTNKAEWPSIHEWLRTQGESFHEAFDPLWPKLR